MFFTGATELRNLHVLTCDSMHVVIAGQGFTYNLQCIESVWRRLLYIHSLLGTTTLMKVCLCASNS